MQIHASFKDLGVFLLGFSKIGSQKMTFSTNTSNYITFKYNERKWGRNIWKKGRGDGENIIHGWARLRIPATQVRGSKQQQQQAASQRRAEMEVTK